MLVGLDAATRVTTVPVLDGICDVLDALDLPAEGVDGVTVLREDLLEKGEVFGVEGNGVAGEGVLDRDVVEGIRRHVWKA